MNDLLRHLHMPPELAWEFLAVFSRMEYALKATGRYAMDANGRVAAAWDRFANDIDKSFCAVEDKDFISAADYLLGNPPRRQVLQNGVMIFIDQKINKDQTKARQTLLMVRTVRNNLFHGGKHYLDGERESGRNHTLVSHSLTVLKHCVMLNDDVRQRYEY